MFERGQRTGIQAVGERVFEQERCHQQQFRFVEVLLAVTLQCAEVVGITELGAQLFEYFPVAIFVVRTEFAYQVIFQVLSHAVVVQQRVVYVEQEYDFFGPAHVVPPSCLGLCHRPWDSISLSASAGPQVSCSYSITGVAWPRTGSITRHASSTQS